MVPFITFFSLILYACPMYNPAAFIQDKNAPVISAPLSPGPSSPAPSSMSGWQLTTSNVGLAGVGIDGTSLPVYTGSLSPAAGTVITGKLITGTGPLDLSAGNITIQRCLIQLTSNSNGMHIVMNQGASMVYIYDCDIDATKISNILGKAYGCAFYGVGDIERCKCWGMGSGIVLAGGSGTSPKAINNYVYGLVTDGSAHNDGAGCRIFTGTLMTFQGNRLDVETTTSSGSFFVQPNNGPINNLVVAGNLFEGAGYNLWLQTDTYTYGANMQAYNNRFTGIAVNNNWWGYAYVQSGSGWSVLNDNYVNNLTSPPNNIGAAVDVNAPN